MLKKAKTGCLPESKKSTTERRSRHTQLCSSVGSHQLEISVASSVSSSQFLRSVSRLDMLGAADRLAQRCSTSSSPAGLLSSCAPVGEGDGTDCIAIS